MGMVASLDVVPAAAFRRHKPALAELEIPSNASSFQLDKAWLELHCALRGMPKPLCLAISGDCPCYSRLEGGLVGIPGELDVDDEEWEKLEQKWEEEGIDTSCYIGFFSPAFVKKLDRALGKLTEEALFAAIKTAGRSLNKGDQKYLRSAFRELKKACQVAAKKGDALRILIT
jgi:hypothetical protein